MQQPVHTLEHFYQENFPEDNTKRLLLQPHLGHFNVFARGFLCRQVMQVCRRDYFKISLVIGTGRVHYPGKTLEISNPSLVFYNPALPYTWETVSEEQGGFFCLFDSQFISPSMADPIVKQSPLFNASLHPVFNLTAEQASGLLFIFSKMTQEADSDYIGKYDVLRNYLHLIFHEAHKMQPANSATEKYLNANVRISSLFVELLERQFPVDSTEHSLMLKTPADFASRLSVHVNHLNRAVREVTGKSTTELIAARVAGEARNLLRFTDNSVADIAYSLGFEHASNFNTFFKKHTGLTPRSARVQLV
jgi:AraC family transcriptional activator of pobA